MERRTKRNYTSDRQLFGLLLTALFLMSSVTTAAMYILGGRANYPYNHLHFNGSNTYSFPAKDKNTSIYNWQDVDTVHLYENNDAPASYWSANELLFPENITTLKAENDFDACFVFEDYTNPNAGSRSALEPLSFTLLFIGFLGFFMQFSQKTYINSRILFDAVVSTATLSITVPAMAAAAFLIKLDSPGPVFYKQPRVGINRRKRRKAEQNVIPGEKRNTDIFGTLFTIYKLRTMYCNAESDTGAVWAKQNDRRITRIGKFLRKTRLDEIPQFFNVLKGEMSIIGPRPERPEFVQQLNK